MRTVPQNCQDQAHQANDAENERQGHNALDHSKSGVPLGMVDRDEGCGNELAPASGTTGVANAWLAGGDGRSNQFAPDSRAFDGPFHGSFIA
jgi:hypothetical protein